MATVECLAPHAREAPGSMASGLWQLLHRQRRCSCALPTLGNLHSASPLCWWHHQQKQHSNLYQLHQVESRNTVRQYSHNLVHIPPHSSTPRLRMLATSVATAMNTHCPVVPSPSPPKSTMALASVNLPAYNFHNSTYRRSARLCNGAAARLHANIPNLLAASTSTTTNAPTMTTAEAGGLRTGRSTLFTRRRQLCPTAALHRREMCSAMRPWAAGMPNPHFNRAALTALCLSQVAPADREATSSESGAVATAIRGSHTWLQRLEVDNFALIEKSMSTL